MSWPFVPTDGKRGDWFRLAANAINYLLRQRDPEVLNERITTLEGSTGWGNYPHSGTQAIPANTRTKLVIDGVGKIESQLPTDTGSLWDTATNTIVGRNGDSIVAKVQFVFTPDDGTAAHMDLQVDIGGAVGVVEEETKDVTRGAGVPHPLSVPFPAYTLNTWAANGGEIYMTVDGPGVVSDARVVILRTHKARAA